VRKVPKLKRLEHVQGGEARFLAGRYSRLSEALRVARIAVEFVRGFRALHRIGPAVTVFGSARFAEGHPYYMLAEKIGGALARTGITVITGGGPGLMEAANRGAFRAGGQSVGASIQLPSEERRNPYLNKSVTFSYFFVRKVILVKYSFGFVVMPGGFGTMDELMEALTLIQTGKLYDFPVILVGVDYWSPFVTWIRGALLSRGTISASDMDYFALTDDVDEIIARIRATAARIGALTSAE